MKDFLGNELNVGDEIVFMEVGYRNLAKGIILKLSPKKAFIQNVSNGGKVMQFYSQIVKVK